MSNQWFYLIVGKRIIVQEKEKKIIKTNYFTTIWSVVKEALRKKIFQLPKKKIDTSVMVNTHKVLTSRCSCMCM